MRAANIPSTKTQNLQVLFIFANFKNSLISLEPCKVCKVAPEMVFKYPLCRVTGIWQS